MRTSTLSSVVVAVTLALTISGCGSLSDRSVTDAGPGGQSDLGSLAGHTYVSTSVTRAGTPHDLVPDSHIWVSFTDGAISASAGCNSLGGSATLSGKALVVEHGLAMTEMACAQPLMDQDIWLADLLGSGPTLNADGDTLTLTSRDTRIELVDDQVATPDRSLKGRAWALDSIGTTGRDGIVSSVPSGVASTLTFTRAGGMGIKPGCNTGHARVDIAATTIRIGKMVLTVMACPGAAQSVEHSVLTVLDGRVAYSIDGRTLTLTRGENVLTYRAT